MDKIIRNYEEPLIKPPTTRDFIKSLMHKRKSKKGGPVIDCGHEHSNDDIKNLPKEIEIMSFAVLVDDVVVEVMNVQNVFGQILEKNPKFVLLEQGNHRPHIGWLYKDNTFIPFEDHLRDIRPTSRG